MAKKNKQKANASGASHDSSSNKRANNVLLPEPKIVKSYPIKKQLKGKNLQNVQEGVKLSEKNEAKGQKDAVISDEKNKEKVQKNALNSDEKNKEKVQKVMANPKQNKNKDRSQGGNSSFNKKDKEQMDQKKKDKLSGLIFMCNGRTKPDCFRYMVMGFPEGRKDLVASIKPGMKLFLYDYDLKLLYGIYNAATAGGMKLEPAAFNGSFSAQVRFKIERDCLPLPVSVFKTAIKENIERNNMFKPELSIDQVKKLLNLFCSTAGQPNAATVTSNPHSMVQPLRVAPVMPTPAILPPPQGGYANGPHVPDTGRHFAKAVPTKIEAVSSKNEELPRESRVLTVKDYHTYGLQPKVQNQAPISGPASIPLTGGPPHSTIPPLDPYHGRPDPYHPQHYPITAPLDPYAAAVKGPLGNDGYLDIRRRGEVGYGLVERSRIDSERLQSTYDVATAALSDYNRRQQRPAGNSDVSSLPVSSRYSFAGPPLSYR